MKSTKLPTITESHYKYSLLINVDKTKVMASDGIAYRVLIQNELLEQEDTFPYLGSLITSVRPILHIGEYSLVALQYRRIRYIGLRVSADTDTPAAIRINSNLTRRLKHGPRRQNVTTNEAIEAGISIHVPRYRLQV